MLPAQRSASSLRWSFIAAVVSHVQTWIRQEIVDDDPWDVETLHPSSPMPTPEPNAEKRRF
jgi:heme/copper-type cytochrome/quinol oxidase subunit 1